MATLMKLIDLPVNTVKTTSKQSEQLLISFNYLTKDTCPVNIIFGEANSCSLPAHCQNYSQHPNSLWNNTHAIIPFSISSDKSFTKTTIAIKYTPASLCSMLCERKGLNTRLTFIFDWISTVFRAFHEVRNRSGKLYFCPSASLQSGWQVGEAWTKPVET